MALALLIMGCKTAQPAATAASAENAKATGTTRIIDGHYANSWNFTTAYLKASVKYKDAKNSQNVSAEIRIKKDEMILVSVRVLGITMAKALITPSKVQYYEKINQEYFEGDYATLSKWLGTDLDYQKVQNLLIGQAMDDLRKGSYTAGTEGTFNTLESQDSTIKKFYFDPAQFLLRKQQIGQPANRRQLDVTYPDFAQYPETVWPKALFIEALQADKRTTIDISYDGAEFNQALTFPYSVPSGYQRIDIND